MKNLQILVKNSKKKIKKLINKNLFHFVKKLKKTIDDCYQKTLMKNRLIKQKTKEPK